MDRAQKSMLEEELACKVATGKWFSCKTNQNKKEELNEKRNINFDETNELKYAYQTGPDVLSEAKKAPRDAPDSLDRALHGAARNHRGMQFADTIKDPQKSSNPNRRIPLKSNNKTNTRRSKQRLKKNPLPIAKEARILDVCFIRAHRTNSSNNRKKKLHYWTTTPVQTTIDSFAPKFVEYYFQMISDTFPERGFGVREGQ